MPIEIIATGEPKYQADPATAWVLETVDRWREHTEKRRRDPGRFHPSDLGKSDAEIVALYNGTAVTFSEPAQKLRVFDNGHGVHSRWGRYLRKSGLTVKHKKNFWMPRLRLRGTCDEIIADATGAAWIVELKSMNPFSFQRLTTGKPEHIDQVHCYMAGLRILQGVLLYENKGDQSVKIFPVPFERDRWRLIEDRLLRLKREAEAIVVERDQRLGPEVIEASEALIAELAKSEGLDELAENDIRRPLALATARQRMK